jgi:DNA polymerase family A
MSVLALDFETFWCRETGYSLTNMSTPEYILDKRFQVILLAAHDLSQSKPQIIMPDDIPAFLARYPPAETTAVAFNYLFDGGILSWRYGWTPAALIDTLGMVRALRQFRRNNLGAVAKELNIGITKGDTIFKTSGLDAEGIRRAGFWNEFCEYAITDNEINVEILRRLWPEFPPQERRIMDLVLRAALQPVLYADVSLLQVHLDELRQEKQRLLTECGYEKAALMSTAQFQEALESLGVAVRFKTSATGRQVPAFAKTDPFMQELCEWQQADDLTNIRIQTLAQARLSHKSTIEETRTQKFLNIARLPWKGGQPLLPVPLRYGGAHTHRLSGEWGLNMQNLPRNTSKSKLRSSLIAPPGNKIITADLSQIECRLVAQFCEQENLLAQFRNNEDVYSNFGSALFGYKINKVDNPNERFISKTAVLGLGYGCGPDRFYRMVKSSAHLFGIQLDGLFDEEIARHTVKLYRYTFNRIPRKWYELDRMIKDNLPINGEASRYGAGLDLVIEPGRIQLPSLRFSFGNGAAVHEISLYLQYKDNELKLLYGAKLLENIIQAMARQVVMQAGLRLAQDHGLRFVGQAHDELIFVVQESQVASACEIIHTEMTRSPPWMPTLPLAAEIGVGDNYGACK